MQTHQMIRHWQPALAALVAICGLPLSAQRSAKTIGEEQLRLWLDMKKSLTASDGAGYFRLNLLNHEIPGGTYGLRWLKGTVLSSEALGTTRNIVLPISGESVPEVTLKIDRLPPANVRIRKGIVVEFDGMGEAFTPLPFMLTLAVEACRQVTNEAEWRCGPERELPNGRKAHLSGHPWPDGTRQHGPWSASSRFPQTVPKPLGAVSFRLWHPCSECGPSSALPFPTLSRSQSPTSRLLGHDSRAPALGKLGQQSITDNQCARFRNRWTCSPTCGFEDQSRKPSEQR